MLDFCADDSVSRDTGEAKKATHRARLNCNVFVTETLPKLPKLPWLTLRPNVY
jgi:hypothetical protein